MKLVRLSAVRTGQCVGNWKYSAIELDKIRRRKWFTGAAESSTQIVNSPATFQNSRTCLYLWQLWHSSIGNHVICVLQPDLSVICFGQFNERIFRVIGADKLLNFLFQHLSLRIFCLRGLLNNEGSSLSFKDDLLTNRRNTIFTGV
jgi:hypothetical protein